MTVNYSQYSDSIFKTRCKKINKIVWVILKRCCLCSRFAGGQLPGATEQTHPQLSADLQDALTFWLVRSVRVAAHPLPAAANPRAEIFLGLQASGSFDAAGANQIPPQPKVSNFTHHGAAEEPRDLLHAGVEESGVPGCLAQPRLGLLLPEAASSAGASG